MLYDADQFDAPITIFKFLAVLASGMLAGESLYVSRTHSPSLLVIGNGDTALDIFRSSWKKGLHLYPTTLVGCFAGFAVFIMEVRDRVPWLYGAFALLAIFLYTKYYMCPRVIDYLMDPDFSKKGESYIHDVLVKFHQQHHPRTAVAALTFLWFIYSLYVS